MINGQGQESDVLGMRTFKTNLFFSKQAWEDWENKTNYSTIINNLEVLLISEKKYEPNYIFYFYNFYYSDFNILKKSDTSVPGYSSFT